ncbi:MAG: PorT family protein [Bacteroidales bacterium]|jgi:hypothetical protein|nr:PorT family protein [Bacteroidales bacterium]NLK80986.1 PorT family protein [Bacteroidales bacterium]HPY82448.1 porin family protein [Bacteroidales bacterium]
MDLYKRIIVACLFVYCSVGVVSAQNNVLFVGARAGVNTSVVLQEITPEGFVVVGKHVGYNFGPTIHFEPKLFFGINSAIIFNSTGWIDKTGEVFDTLLYRKDVFKNIQIPLTVSLKFGIGEYGRIVIEGGGYAQYTLSGYSDFKDLSGQIHKKAVDWIQWNESDSEYDISYKRMNMGAVFGVGFQHKCIYIGANYNLGLFNITKNELCLHNHIWNMYVIVRTWKRKT